MSLHRDFGTYPISDQPRLRYTRLKSGVGFMQQYAYLCYFSNSSGKTVLICSISQTIRTIIWALMRKKKLFSGFPTKPDSNQSAQLQRLATKFACGKFRYD